MCKRKTFASLSGNLCPIRQNMHQCHCRGCRCCETLLQATMGTSFLPFRGVLTFVIFSCLTTTKTWWFLTSCSLAQPRGEKKTCQRARRDKNHPSVRLHIILLVSEYIVALPKHCGTDSHNHFSSKDLEKHRREWEPRLIKQLSNKKSILNDWLSA